MFSSLEREECISSDPCHNDKLMCSNTQNIEMPGVQAKKSLANHTLKLPFSPLLKLLSLGKLLKIRIENR